MTLNAIHGRKSVKWPHDDRVWPASHTEDTSTPLAVSMEPHDWAPGRTKSWTKKYCTFRFVNHSHLVNATIRQRIIGHRYGKCARREAISALKSSTTWFLLLAAMMEWRQLMPVSIVRRSDQRRTGRGFASICIFNHSIPLSCRFFTCAAECYSADKNRWFEATSMNHFRSAHTASVLAGLPNVMDYVYKNRMNLLEERRQYMVQRMQVTPFEGNWRQIVATRNLCSEVILFFFETSSMQYTEF